jgi:hypothetical protein
MKKWSLLGIVLILVIAIAATFIFKPFASRSAASTDELKTYFNYSPAELEQLKNLSTNKTITATDISQINLIMFNLIRKYKLGDAYAAEVMAYLYTAQRDAAALAYQTHGEFIGNINVISSQILCMFFTKECANGQLKQVYFSKDEFSTTVANIVFPKYQQRYQQDRAQRHLYKEQTGALWWAGIRPYYGQEVGSWQPWIMQNVKQFVAAVPAAPTDKAYWQQQTSMTKSVLEHITDDQIKKVVYWAGGPGTMTPPGIWLNAADEYMQKQQVALPEMLWINSQLAMGLMDACIAVFDSKYTYWVKRPFMQDPSIITIMPTPNHPSYPAGHSTISGAAAEILSYYLPANTTVWWQLANDASQSRVNGGIHFTVDAQQGMKLGSSVGKATIESGK